MLTVERLKELIHYDPLTGVFTRITVLPGTRAKLGPIKGTAKNGKHLKTCVDGKEYYFARLAHFYMTGDWGVVVDHRDNNPQNNRWKNLRNTSIRGNVQNQTRAHHHNATGLLGVHYDEKRKKYESQITVNKVRIHLGRFDTAKEAHEAYKGAKRIHHSTCSI